MTALMLAGTLAGAQQPTVVVRDAGPGPVGRYLETVLRRPDTRVVVADTFTVAKDSSYPASLVVIGRQVNVRGRVTGDLVVVGGDLFLKPNGRIEGQGIAIGGGAHNSVLGSVGEGLVSYRDFTFDATTVDGVIELRYREQYVGLRSFLQVRSLYWLRIPSYDRSNGLSLPVGPSVDLGPANIDLVATYRSQIGRIDPSVAVRLHAGRKLWVDAWAGRESRTNDGWINGSLSNSVNSLLSGHDERNWYRATGGRLTASRMFETATMTATYSLGGSFERSRAARPGLFPTSSPWSFTDRADVENGMFRPNPQIIGGDVTSAIGAAAYRWTSGDLKARLKLDLEVPVSVSTGESFAQATVDGRIEFPTFGDQRFRLDLHGVATGPDAAPGQRYAYLGGPGTLPTEEILLRFGGDEALFVESRYEVPIPAIQLPLAGTPTVTFRHILGAAGVQALPELTQIVGLRISVPFVRVQYLIDTDTRKSRFSAGFSLNR
jgi:hypothetical protein